MGLKNEVDLALKVHKGLKYNSKRNELYGQIMLPSCDTYSVRIDLSPYPIFFPFVYEIDGRIPCKVERHIYTGTGACCFTTSAYSQILLKTKVKSLLIFLNEIVIKYFENNSFYEINGHYFSNEYSHGSIGIVESYNDILGISNMDVIFYLFIERLKNKFISEKDLCYCNSKEQLIKCNDGNHLKNYNNFLLINKETLRNDLHHFTNVFKLMR